MVTVRRHRRRTRNGRINVDKHERNIRKKNIFPQNSTRYGFDLTDFGSSNTFKKVLSKNGLSNYRRIATTYAGNSKYYKFVWANKNVRLITGNNPITGEYSSPSQREREFGYASYIGIEGEEKAVENLVKDIKYYAIGIKGESPGTRDFI